MTIQFCKTINIVISTKTRYFAVDLSPNIPSQKLPRVPTWVWLRSAFFCRPYFWLFSRAGNIYYSSSKFLLCLDITVQINCTYIFVLFASTFQVHCQTLDFSRTVQVYLKLIFQCKHFSRVLSTCTNPINSSFCHPKAHVEENHHTFQFHYFHSFTINIMANKFHPILFKSFHISRIYLTGFA